MQGFTFLANPYAHVIGMRAAKVMIRKDRRKRLNIHSGLLGLAAGSPSRLLMGWRLAYALAHGSATCCGDQCRWSDDKRSILVREQSFAVRWPFAIAIISNGPCLA